MQARVRVRISALLPTYRLPYCPYHSFVGTSIKVEEIFSGFFHELLIVENPSCSTLPGANAFIIVIYSPHSRLSARFNFPHEVWRASGMFQLICAQGNIT